MARVPEFYIPTTAGVNCDHETKHAVEKAGGKGTFVLVSEVASGKVKIDQAQGLVFPGGFSYGDHPRSGVLLASDLRDIAAWTDQINELRHRGGIIVGICNGCQGLACTGIVPAGHFDNPRISLTANESGKFECRWVTVQPEIDHNCKFLTKLKGPLYYQVAHGEGRFTMSKRTLKEVEREKLVVLRYSDKDGNVTQNYPDNPNGSMNAIAGMTDKTGQVFVMMPHPERFMDDEDYFNWRKEKITKPHGRFIFEGMVDYAKQS